MWIGGADFADCLPGMSKGSRRRKAQVPDKTVADNWERIFKANKDIDLTQRQFDGRSEREPERKTGQSLV